MFRSRWEAFAEGDQQPGRPLDADALAQERPQQAPLFRQETQPRIAVGGHMQIGLALMTILHLQGAVLVLENDGPNRKYSFPLCSNELPRSVAMTP